MDPAKSAPGHTQTLGKPVEGCASTLIMFQDKSMLLVHWDGDHEVAGLREGSGAVMIYCSGGRQLFLPWHRIDHIDHQSAKDNDR